MEYRPMEEGDLDGILEICRSECWPSHTADRGIAWRAFTAPGVVTFVAVDGCKVAGFVQMQSDGFIQAHLSLIAVSKEYRRRGVARRLIKEAFLACGGKRVDLVTGSAEPFYESFAHRRLSGFRIYPDG